MPADIPPVPRVWTFGSAAEIRTAREPVIFIRAEPRIERPEAEGADEPPPRLDVDLQVFSRQVLAATSSTYLMGEAKVGGSRVLFTQVTTANGLYTYVTYGTLRAMSVST
jgi:hypothetical protein